MRTHGFALISVLGLALAGSPGFASAQVPPVPPTPETARVPRPPRPPREARARARWAFEETDKKTLTVSHATELDLSNIAGDIVVVPGSGQDATIEYTRHGFGDTQEEAKRQVAMLEVSLNVIDGRGIVSTRFAPGDDRYDRGRRSHSSVDYRVTAPPQTRIRVKSMSGDIRVSKMMGDLALESISGDISVEAGGRVSLAKTMSGDISISGVTADEPLSVSSISGTVTLRSFKARYLDINSVSGDVYVKDVSCERAELQTISGNVEYAGQVLKNGRYELKAHSGDIRLLLAGDTGFDMEANSFSGKIRSDLPIKNEAEQEAGGDFYAGGVRVRMPRRSVFRGRYKDGSATIELATFSGNITITK